MTLLAAAVSASRSSFSDSNTALWSVGTHPSLESSTHRNAVLLKSCRTSQERRCRWRRSRSKAIQHRQWGISSQCSQDRWDWRRILEAVSTPMWKSKVLLTKHDCRPAEQLEPRQTLCPHIVRKDLYHVDVRQGIVTNTVCWRIEEDEHKHGVARLFTSCNAVPCLRNRPCGVYCKQTTRAEQVHLTSREPWGNTRHQQTD